jgi:hypothetical protein
LLYDNAGEVLRDGETTIRAIETYHQLGSIEGSTLRAPEGQEDDRAMAFVLAFQARAQRLRWGKFTSDGACVLVPGRADQYAPDWGPQGRDPRDGHDGSWDAGFCILGMNEPPDPHPFGGCTFIPYRIE